MLYLHFVALLLTLFSIMQPTSTGCVSLVGSTACPEFGDYSIDLSTPLLGNQYPNLDAVDNFLNGNSMIRDMNPSCHEWEESKQQVRYAKTLRCVALIAKSSSCNKSGKGAAKLCKSSCSHFCESYEQVGKKMCASNSTGVDKQTANWNKFCDSAPTSQCISGEKNEEIGCGRCLTFEEKGGVMTKNRLCFI
jgi:hypothetical protein